jgi:hypothetical protein
MQIIIVEVCNANLLGENIYYLSRNGYVAMMVLLQLNMEGERDHLGVFSSYRTQPELVLQLTCQ